MTTNNDLPALTPEQQAAADWLNERLTTRFAGKAPTPAEIVAYLTELLAEPPDVQITVTREEAGRIVATLPADMLPPGFDPRGV